MDVISFEGLTKRFGPVIAVNGLDLTVSPGQVYGFLGPNGAGKTTTIRMLLGLIARSAGQSLRWSSPASRAAGSAGQPPARVRLSPSCIFAACCPVSIDLSRDPDAHLPGLK